MGEGIEEYRSVVIKQSQDVEYSLGNVTHRTVISVYGAEWVQEILGRTLCKVYDCLTTMLHI